MRAVTKRPLRPASAREHPDWGQLLIEAVNTPGIISSAYHKFWSYSVGNQILAWIQCIQRKIDPGPIHTFVGWKELGRHVKKGEKALVLCMPCTVKVKAFSREIDETQHHRNGAETLADGDHSDKSETAATRTHFMYKANWFVLSQTEGRQYVPAELPEWSESHALSRLKIERIAFRHTDGNAQGYAVDRQIAVSPVAFMPARTVLHELAHVVLGHTNELYRLDDDDSTTPRDLREVEAESVALICCCSLKLGGEEFSRGYIQHWLKGQTIPERSAQKIFKAADQILKAGRTDDEVHADCT